MWAGKFWIADVGLACASSQQWTRDKRLAQLPARFTVSLYARITLVRTDCGLRR